MRRPLNTVWKIPKHLTSHTRAYAYFSNILFNLDKFTLKSTVAFSELPIFPTWELQHGIHAPDPW